MAENTAGSGSQAYAVLDSINSDLHAVQRMLEDFSQMIKPHHLDLLRLSVSEIRGRMCELVDRMKDDVMAEGKK